MANFRRSGSFALSPKRQAYASPGTFTTPSTRRQSLNCSANSLLFDAGNNDEAEKRERQLNRLQKLQSRGVHSPTATPADRRKSTSAFAGFTHQQITEHYAKCIQLSAENKINIKNAFNLQLIDYMAENMKHKDSEMNNFQVASCTLDASTKIYGYRVDSVHSDTLKMAGGLGRTKDRPDENEEALDEENPKGKKRVKTKKRVTVEKNLRNINVPHFDLEFDVDPLFKKTASQFDEGRIGGGQFLNVLQFTDDRCQIILDSETVLITNDTYTEQSQAQTTVMPPLSDLSRVICSTFAPFEFTTWKLSDEDSFRDAVNAYDDAAENELAFDINAVPEPLENDQFEGDDFNDIPYHEDNEEDDNRTVVTIGGGNACQQGRPPPQLEVIHLKDHLASNPLEYSYFDTRVMSAWAGPGHWKLKSLMKEKDTTKQGNKVKRKNNNDVTIEYKDDLDVEKHFTKSKRTTNVLQSTIKKWSSANTTLPIDLHFDSSNFFKLFERPGVIIRKQEIKSEVEEIKLEDEMNCSNKIEENDGLDDEGSNYGDHTAAGYDETDLFSQTVFPSQPEKIEQRDFLGDNLVEAPNKVAQINIGYARTAKKIDMKKLKTSMWTLLIDEENNKENERNNLNDQMDSKRKEKFSILYTDLHPRLPQKMSENLSVPLAFIALLHLANEHNLKLTSLEELGDFTISQG